jgi:hypothetical protein
MIDKDFFKKDTEYYNEFRMLSSSEKENIRKKYQKLRRKAVKLLNDDLHNQGHTGSIGGIDVADDEIWKYLDGKEKELFNKYARILDFVWGFKPHQESYKIKRFNEMKLIKEGLRFNTTYLTLPKGEYNIKDVLKEVEELKEDLEMWLKGGWQTVTAVDKEHKEIIPLMK